MRTISRLTAAAALASALAVPVAADAAVTPPKAPPTAKGYGGAAATVDPYATQAAIDVLRRGGNAIDATVAAAGVLGVVEPYSSGVGGGGFMVIRRRNGQVTTIDGREFAPAAYTDRSLLEPATGEPLDFDAAVTSGLGVGVPGSLATWQRALRRYGTRSLRAMLRPGIRVASRGFVVDKTLQSQTEENAERFADFPATAATYLPGGAPIRAGSTLRNPDLARTYRLLARRGARAFYTGPLARDIVRAVRQPPVRSGATRIVRPGVMTRADLAAYRTVRRAPTRTRFRGATVQGMAPPSSGGSTVAEALNIIEAFGPPARRLSTELYRYLEASKLAVADRGKYLGDPAFVKVPLRCLTSQAFASVRARLIGATALPTPVAPGSCPVATATTTAGGHEGQNTTHLTVADRFGNVVAYTLTIEQTGGSAITVPGRGFLLNNELTDFTFTPGTANSPAARKRPRSSIAPTIVTRRGRPVVALGSPGGSTIITTVLQTLVNRFDRRLSRPASIAAPRASQRNGPATDVEPAFARLPAAARLLARGEVFSQDYPSFPDIGAATGIDFKRRGRLVAAAEPVRRGGGSAMVVSKRRPRR